MKSSCQMQNINYLQGSSTLRVLKLNHSLAMELNSTQDATKHAMRILDAKYKKADLQSIVRGNCKHLSTNQKGRDTQLGQRGRQRVSGEQHERSLV
jgi:hypothetical protein